ncbi:hypothetical protein [Paenibacillus sp. 481]|uniref:hypothetical protein n=1 Tax=Paenibacillus sp. 481 TaxID=2835869 RepID=UPI001E5FFD19|nr:hypothetical protein [Paenibacillus sp. 481]UHA72892.1 hypothetical protein KIK04_20060 [Paenibacillus sp. 481]
MVDPFTPKQSKQFTEHIALGNKMRELLGPDVPFAGEEVEDEISFMQAVLELIDDPCQIPSRDAIDFETAVTAIQLGLTGVEPPNEGGGFTVFVPVSLKTDYTNVDLVRKLVNVIVSYDEEIIMTVTVDVQNDLIHKEGSFEQVLHLEKYGITEERTMERIKEKAEFFVQNNISDPSSYFIS